MDKNIFSMIQEDVLVHEEAKILLHEIKEFAKKNADKTFPPGKITEIVLEDMLKEIIENSEKGIMKDEKYGIILEILILKYLDKEPLSEIELKL
jgi:hypothetical protein